MVSITMKRTVHSRYMFDAETGNFRDEPVLMPPIKQYTTRSNFIPNGQLLGPLLW